MRAGSTIQRNTPWGVGRICVLPPMVCAEPRRSVTKPDSRKVELTHRRVALDRTHTPPCDTDCQQDHPYGRTNADKLRIRISQQRIH